MRLFFASFPLWSLGLLTWVPSLRFAIIRRRRLDWAVFGLAVALTVIYVVLLFVFGDEKSTGSGFAGMYILALIGGSVVHAVLGDRFLRDPASYRTAAPTPHPAPYPAPTPHPAPYPGSAPYSAPPVGPHAAGIANAPTVYGYPRPVAPPPVAAPPPPAPQSPRMRQVASELDELDALLRGRDGRESR